MELPFLHSGLPAAWAEVRAFLAAVKFERPALLWIALAPTALAILGWAVRKETRRALAAVGSPGAVAALMVGRRRSSFWGRMLLGFSWSLLALGAAGPRWGTGGESGVAVGRDVAIVLDLSRSMLVDDMAETPNQRWKAGVRAAEDLVESLRARGGHRAALIVFAARPKLVVPLTTDVDHLRSALAGLNAEVLPPETRALPDSKSGTRIGAAISAAVAALDPKYPGFRDIVLISDGDDPVNDREWAVGVDAARQAGIPVHAVGLGNPTRSSPVFVDGIPLDFVDGKDVTSVQSRLHEEVLQAIAAEGHGEYRPGRTGDPRLGEFYRTKIEPNPSRILDDDLIPQSKNRSVWFLLGGTVLFLLATRREG